MSAAERTGRVKTSFQPRASIPGKKDTQPKVPPNEFIQEAIKTLRRGKQKGITLNKSGLAGAMYMYYQTDPTQMLEELSNNRVIVIRPTKGDDRHIYLPDDMPEYKPVPNPEDILNQVLLKFTAHKTK